MLASRKPMGAGRLLRLWCGLVLAALLLVPASMLFLDAPVAGFFARVFHLSALIRYAPTARQADEIVVIAGAVILLFCVSANRLPPWAEATLVSAVAVLGSYYLTEHFLKPFFERPDFRSLFFDLRSVLGWHGRAAAAFPSAHGAIAAAALSVTVFYFADLRWTALFGITVIDLLMIVARVHYTSDVLAGNILGTAIAVLACQVAWVIKASRDNHSSNQRPEKLRS
jgi:membrane-associated phospholipid phosphatase